MGARKESGLAVRAGTPLAGAAALVAMAAMPMLVAAKSFAGESIDWKLTYTHHRTDSDPDGHDLNLRGTRGETVFWAGHYSRADEFRQTRGGLERWMSFDWGRLLLSGQAATRGFLGFASQAEIGKGSVRFLAGFGRTNLRPYYNLNFDPNDAITLGFAAELPEGMRASVFAVHDDRLGTGQTVVHAVLRTHDAPANRWTIDLWQRRGPLGDGGERVHRTGIAVTFDRAPCFGRIAIDPNANFSGRDMIRLGFGARF